MSQDSKQPGAHPLTSTSPGETGPTPQTAFDTTQQMKALASTGTTLPGLGHDRAHDPNDPFIGRELNSYRLVKRIGQGGMGNVYLGQHTLIGRKAAVKILKTELCQDQEVVERFYQEARSVGTIKHENIIDVYDFGRTEEGQVFFMMELLEGSTLSDRLRKGPLSFAEAQPLLLQAAEALGAAHQKGITHRDIKPDNLFLVERAGSPPKVKVLDFGLAKLAGTGSVKERLTQAGTILGTPHYMSPEQIDGGQIDPRADIYSFGAVMYEIFAGRPPFEGETVGALLKGHLFMPVPPLRASASLGVPAKIGKIVGRALEKKAAARYASMQELAADLRAAASDAELLPTPKDRPGGARLWLAGGAVVAAAGATALILWSPWSRIEPPPPPPPAPQAQSGPTLDKPALQKRALETLRTALGASDAAQRAQAARALGAVRDAGSQAALVALLGDAEPAVVFASAEALAELGDPQAAGALREARARLGDGNAGALDHALARLGDEEARARLLAQLKANPEPTRLAAALALAELGELDAEPVLLGLMASTEAATKQRAPEVLRGLLRLGNPEAQKRLEGLLQNENEEARLSAAELLASVGDNRGQEVVEQLFANGAPRYKLVAARALVLLGDYSGNRVFLEALQGQEASTREAGLAGLALIADQNSLAQIEPLLANDPDPLVRLAAARAIVEIVGLSPELLASTSADWLSGALASQDEGQRAAAARALVDLKGEGALAELQVLAKDESAEVRKAAAEGLGALLQSGNAGAVDTAKGLLADANAGVAGAAVVALAQSKDQKAAEDALRAAPNESPGALAAAGILAAKGDKEAFSLLRKRSTSKRADERALAMEAADLAGDVETLKKGLGDRAAPVQIAAAKGLAARGDKEAIAVLSTLSKEGSPAEAAAASDALAALGIAAGEASTPRWPVGGALAAKREALGRVRLLPADLARRLLLRAVRDTDPKAQSAAISAIAELEAKDPKAAEALYQSAIDAAKTPEVEKQARAALARLKSSGPHTPAATTLAPATAPASQPQETSLGEDEKEKNFALLKSTAGLYIARLKYREGIDRYKEAQKIKPDPYFDLEIGDAYRKWGDSTFGDDKARLGRYKNAKSSYQRYLSRSTLQGDKVRGYIKELERQITDLDAKVKGK